MQSSAKAIGRSDDARHRGDHGLERFLRVAAFRPAVMRQQDHLAAAVGDLDDGRGIALDARDVGDFAVVHGNVEVDANKNAFAFEVGVVEGAEAHDGKL